MFGKISPSHGLQVIYDNDVPKGTSYVTAWYVVIGTRENTVTTSRQLIYDIDKMRGLK